MGSLWLYLLQLHSVHFIRSLWRISDAEVQVHRTFIAVLRLQTIYHTDSYVPNTIPSQVTLRLGIIWLIIILTLSSTLSHRWRSLCSALFLALWLSLSCIGWLGADEIFLRGPKVPFDWKPSFNAWHTRMGDVCEVETRIQFVMDWDSDRSDYPQAPLHIMLRADSDIIHVNALGTSIIILNSYKVATDLLDQRSSTYSSR